VLFQTLDEKENCVSVYLDGDLHQEVDFSKLTKTWKYSAFLRDYNIEYANLYCQGKSLDEICPDHLRERWVKINDKLKAHYRSFVEAKISLVDNCFFDLVPRSFLLEFCDVKNQITEHVFKTYEKPDNYDFMVDLTKLIIHIKYSPLNVDISQLSHRMSEYKVRKFCKKIRNISPHIDYNIFGTKTGRLATKRDSFPILTMDKTYRPILRPQNDLFLELDYNAAELRTFLSLSGKQQPSDDIHDWNVKNVYRNLLTRDEAKKRIFAWLYNPNSKDYLSSRVYDCEKVLREYWDGEQVTTIYNRMIPADEHHALNYIVQSTFSDLILRQAIKIHEMTRNMKTKIAFMIHDSIVLDYSEEDKPELVNLAEAFSNTELGNFKASAKLGKSFGEMKELWM